MHHFLWHRGCHVTSSICACPGCRGARPGRDAGTEGPGPPVWLFSPDSMCGAKRQSCCCSCRCRCCSRRLGSRHPHPEGEPHGYAPRGDEEALGFWMLPSCVSRLSVPVTNTGATQLVRGKGLLAHSCRGSNPRSVGPATSGL